ncbi:MAG: hypothetical protein IPL06_01025 [Betaproteobacteria bacterium]|nr:hypothetical protein [Betaproteobacteria bacterium]
MLRTLFLIATLAAGAPALAADPVAFVTNMKGEVAVDGGSRPLLMSELGKGQKVALGKEATLSVMFIQSGKEFVLKGPGDFAVGEREMTVGSGMPPSSRETSWRASGDVLVKVAQTQSASIRMRSAAPSKPLAPVRLEFPVRGAVSTLQPVLRWAAGEGKAPAEVIVAPAGAEDKPVVKAKSTGTTMKVPAKLKPDTEYVWSVTVSGTEIGKASFRTLPAASIDKAEKRRPAEKAEFSDRALYALLLQELGAAQEAAEWWGRLAQERGDLPEIAALAK